MSTPTSPPKRPSVYRSFMLTGNCKTGILATFVFTDDKKASVRFSNTGKKTDDGKFEIFVINADEWELDTKVIAKETFVLKGYQEGKNFVCEIIKVKNAYKKTWKNRDVKSITSPKSPCVFNAPGAELLNPEIE